LHQRLAKFLTIEKQDASMIKKARACLYALACLSAVTMALLIFGRAEKRLAAVLGQAIIETIESRSAATIVD
jgi:hypothetical protein